MVDSDEKPVIGFIYDEMDIAKEKIQTFSMELLSLRFDF